MSLTAVALVSVFTMIKLTVMLYMLQKTAICAVDHSRLKFSII